MLRVKDVLNFYIRLVGGGWGFMSPMYIPGVTSFGDGIYWVKTRREAVKMLLTLVKGV